MIKKIRQNYHWVIAFLAFLEMIIFGGLLNSASVFIIPMCETLEVSRGSFSMALIPYSITCTAGTMISGYLFQRFGYKKSAIVSLILVAVSLVMTATCQTLTGFCISKIVMGLGYGACFTAGAVRIVKDWFFKHQGLVIGLVSMSSGLGGSLMTVVLSSWIADYGWRAANMALALVVGLIAVSYWLLKDKPEQMGLKPFGYGIASEKKKKSRNADQVWEGFSLQQLLRRPLLYLMAASTLITCVMLYLTSGVVLPYFRDQGFSQADAAMYQSIYMLMLAVAKLLCGAMCDRIGAKPVSVICMICAALGQGILGITADPALCMLGTLLSATGLSMSSVMIPLLAAPMFGYRAGLNINGILLAMSSLASIFSNPISNLFYDRLGSYCPVFLAAGIINAAMIPVYYLMFAMAKREKTKFESQNSA